MDYAPEEYTRFYITQALFKLMADYEYEKISVTDIVEKAGVGRATFYRYFKRKEDVIEFWFLHNTKEFMSEQRYYPRCRADYMRIVHDVFDKFLQNKDKLKLIKRAHLEYLYLDYLNRKFIETFRRDYDGSNPFAPYIYAGMVFNVSMLWLDRDCADSIDDLANAVMDAIYFDK